MKENEIKNHQTVQRWFHKGNYTEKTKKVYLGYMLNFCRILGKTPNDLVKDIVTSDSPITEMEDIHKKLATHMKNKQNMKVRTIDQRMNTLHRFWHHNNIKLTRELVRHFRLIVWDVIGEKE